MIPIPRDAVPFDGCLWCGSVVHQGAECPDAPKRPESNLLGKMAAALERLPPMSQGGFYANAGNPLVKPLADKLGAKPGDLIYVPLDPSKPARICD